MSVKLNNDQYLLWIKDPSISPYINIVYRNKNIHNDRILISTYINNDYKEPSIQNDRMSRKNILTDEAHYEFVRKLLLFWTGFSYYDKHADIGEGGYKFFYMYGGDTRRFPIAHTCSYQFEFYGFPVDIQPEDKETYLYEKIKYAVFGSAGMDLA